MYAILLLRIRPHLCGMPDQCPVGWHLLVLLPYKMYPGGQVPVTVSPTAVPLTEAITPLPIPGSPQPPA